MTRLAEKFSEVGMRKDDYEIWMRMMDYRKGGGTLDRLIGIARDVFARELPGKGQVTRATNGHTDVAQPRQTLEDATGQNGGAEKATLSMPLASSSPSERDGQHVHAAKTITTMPSARAVIKPKPSRGLAAIAARQETIHRGALVLMKTGDGRAWGKVHWYELQSMRRDGNVADIVLKNVLAPSNHNKTLNEILTDAQFTELHNAAQKLIACV